MTKSVSVIIPTYNYGKFIADAIRSALDQTRPPTEVIVVDDGSTDDTAEIVSRFGDAVNYIRQENAGVCAARNFGVGRSTGELLAFLDADDIWNPSKLEAQVDKFANEDHIGLVHCGVREFDGDSGETIGFHSGGAEDDAAHNLLLWEEPSVNVSGSVVMVSRKAFDAVDGFDPRMKVGEDWDFCYRVARRFKVRYVPEPLVNYRIHAGAAHRNVENMESGMLIFYEKAFADPSVAHLKRHALGNFHKVIAGSYFHAGRTGKFLSHAAKSILMRPSGISYFLTFPIRRLTRARSLPRS